MFDSNLEWVALLSVTCIFIIGLIGSLLPVLPGCVIIWLGIIIYKWVLPESLTWTFVMITGILTLVAQLLDYVCTYLGAKRFGGTVRGGVGALLGAIIGPFVLGPFITPLGGIVVGPVIGAVIGEISAGKTMSESGKAGVGTIVGGLASFLIKLGIACLMVGWFYWQTLGGLLLN